MHPLHTEDLFATLVGLAGGWSQPPAPRVDFAPYLRGEAGEPVRDGVLLEFVTETRQNRAYYDETWRGIRTRTHKYTVLGSRSGADPWQLFDLAADPSRKQSGRRSGARAVAADLHRRLIALLDASEDDYALAPAFGIAGRARGARLKRRRADRRRSPPASRLSGLQHAELLDQAFVVDGAGIIENVDLHHLLERCRRRRRAAVR